MSNVVNLAQRQNGKRKNVIIGLLVTVVILASILYYLLHIVKIAGIVVVGNTHYSNEEMIRMVGAEEYNNILSLYFKQNTDFSNYPYIESVEIVYEDYNKIQIVVKEKNVIAYFYYMGQYMCLDKDGYIIDYTKDRDMSIPLIEGIVIESFVLGKPLELNSGIIDAILKLYQLQIRYGLDIDSIEFVYNDANDINLYIGGLVVHLGTLEKLDKKIEIVSQVMSKLDQGVEGHLDLIDPDRTPILKKSMNKE